MSQAVAAPITGDSVITGGFSAISSDLSAGNGAAEIPSRRAVLAGLCLAPISPTLKSNRTARPMRVSIMG